MAKIEHVFVLMLENRSFDHMLGFSGLPGVPEPPAKFGFKPGAMDQLADDPKHEFENVAAQIHGGAMDGFGKVGSEPMLGFDANAVSDLIALAGNNLYFDNWYSSMPGPTWPNRLFAHAASSGGLDNSLSAFDAAKAVTNPGFYLDFENGHIFNRLTGKNVQWRVYHHHGNFDIDYPQVLCLKGMVDKRNDKKFFRKFSDFASDMSGGDVVGYTFIEPKYDLPGYSQGNSQHPIGTISSGGILIKAVHDAIFKQKVGANSALLITWDEHGGFFDHVPPPVAVPPGDKPLNHDRAKTPGDCPFDRFGVRVPAVLISPWLPTGLGTNVFGKKAKFDHASIVKALRSTFALGSKLTDRDEASPDWNSVLLAKPRQINLKLPKIAAPKFRAPVRSMEEIAAAGPPSGNLLGVSQIAVDIDWHTAERLRVPPHVVSDFAERMKRAETILSEQTRGAFAAAEITEAHLSVLQYIAAVQKRDARLKTAESRKPTTKRPARSKSRPKSSAKPQGSKRSRSRRAR